MSVYERVQRDLDRGDHWLARQRLASFLSTKGYDADLLARLGKISHDMHDACEAGRMWLTSSAEGNEVERAVDVFVRHTGGDARQIVAQLPRAARLGSLDAYPPVVRQRLRRLGLQDLARHVAPDGGVRTSTSGWGRRIAFGVFLILLATWFVVSCSVGAVRIFTWTTGR